MTAPELLVVGLSHHTAPLALRERLAVKAEGLASEVRSLVETGAFSEAMVISTCNRVEVYGSTKDAARAVKLARARLAERAAPEAIDSFLYERWGVDAVKHTFRVAASLDSMVIGEPQILGQVKEAFHAAQAADAMGSLLGRCMTHAFAVAKRVRRETGVASGAVSVSSIAVELARKIFGGLDRRQVLLVGAGKMGEAAASKLAKLGAKVVVINRSPERAREVAAACGGEPKGLESLQQELVAADVVVTSTASDRFVITAEVMHDVVRARRRRELFVIDIAVPRNVDPRVADMDNVFLYDVDDLQEVAQDNIAARRREAAAAEGIVATEVAHFEQWRRSLDLTPTIVALRERCRAVVRQELERTMPRLSGLGESDKRALEAMADAIVNKLLHKPLTQLKRGADAPDGAQLIDAARRLFELDTPSSIAPPAPSPETADAHTDDAAVRELSPAAGGKRR